MSEQQNTSDKVPRIPSKALQHLGTLEPSRAREEILARVVFRLAGTGKEAPGIAFPRLETLNLTALFLLYQWDPIPACLPADASEEDFVPLTMDHIGRAGLSIPELFRQSLKNMIRLLPPRGENLAGLVGEREQDQGLLVLTNRVNLYGAAVVFYPGLLKSLADAVGGSFYLIPSSVHEMILLPGESLLVPVAEVNEMIRDINRADVAPKDVLSETLYRYDPERDEIVIA
ncbi:MAG: DUF5688 family protein [Firmicutes bacterium]|nr:DUF5688 family protein [Bacillota bacterium]